MIYVIKKQLNGYYTVTGSGEYIIHVCKDLTLEEANRTSWLEKNPRRRYQVFANLYNGRQELTWYSQVQDIIILKRYPTIEEARFDIVRDLKEVCYNHKYKTHPNPHGSYAIIDTFTGDEVNYQISEEESRYPTEADFLNYYLSP